MPYPEDYLETVEQARQERDSARERALEVMVSSMVDYGRGVPGLPRLGGRPRRRSSGPSSLRTIFPARP